MEGQQAEGELDFDRAAYTHETAGPPCESCGQPLADEYWQWSSRAICERCKNQVEGAVQASRSRSAFGKAALLGGGTALGCGIAYAVFVHLTDYQLALITIGIAFLVAKVLRRCSTGIGGRRYQVLAVALTYFASALGYAPAVFSGVSQASTESAPAATSTAAAAPASPPGTEEPPGAGGLLIGTLLLLGLTLAAPILAATDAPIGLLIVGFGLWEAWRLTGSAPVSISGPYRRTAAATGPPP